MKGFFSNHENRVFAYGIQQNTIGKGAPFDLHDKQPWLTYSSASASSGVQRRLAFWKREVANFKEGNQNLYRISRQERIMKRIIYVTFAITFIGSTFAFAQGQARAQAGGTAQPAGSVMGTFGSGPPPTPPAPGTPARVGQPRIPARGPSIDLAYEAAKAAVASCTGKPIGVAIVDKTGQAKLIYIPDGSVTDNAATAMRKANTALLIGAPSNQLYARATADKTLAAKVLNNSNYIIWGGGLPIIVNGEVIGAIGVSGGGPEGIDDGCAKAALDSIQDRLK